MPLVSHPVRASLNQPQPVLELRDAELELVPFIPRDRPELVESPAYRPAGAFADTDGIPAPARRRVIDPAANLVLSHPAAFGERLRKLVRALGRQRDRAQQREPELSQGAAC